MNQKIGRRLSRALCAAALGLTALPAGAMAPPGRYTIPGDGTVHDTQTGLVWQQTLGDNSSGQSFSAAASYCGELGLPGVGWRVPSMKELQTLVDETESGSSIDPVAFPSTPPTSFWTSSPLAGSSYARFVVFDVGSTGSYDASSLYRVRCVR